MGFSSEPNITTFDPTPGSAKGATGAAGDFLQGLFQNPGQSPFGGMTSPLQQQAVGNLSTFLGMPSPESRVLGQAESPLLAMLNAGGQAQNAGFQQAQQLVGAAQPAFQQNLQAAQGQLASRAPSTLNTAFAGQGIDLASRALQDFNLFQNQAFQQGMGLDLQARGLAQQGALGAGGLLGQLAGQAGMNPFQRLLGAGQLGGQLSQQAINPTLQLLLGGLGFAQPMAQEAIVQPGGGGLGQFLGGLGGTVLGSFLGPLGSAAGGALGGKLFDAQPAV